MFYGSYAPRGGNRYDGDFFDHGFAPKHASDLLFYYTQVV